MLLVATGCISVAIWVMEVGLGSKTQLPWHAGQEQRGGSLNETVSLADPPLVLALVSCHGAAGCRLAAIWVMKVGLEGKTQLLWHTGQEPEGGRR